jgi:hypothetical protein
MSPDTTDRVSPVGESEMLRQVVEHHGGGSLPPMRHGRSIPGVVSAVHAPQHHAPESGHKLDITIGQETAQTEIVIHVTSGDYHNLEGHRVVIQVEE